mgnify:FL=1
MKNQYSLVDLGKPLTVGPVLGKMYLIMAYTPKEVFEEGYTITDHAKLLSMGFPIWRNYEGALAINMM